MDMVVWSLNVAVAEMSENDENEYPASRSESPGGERMTTALDSVTEDAVGSGR